MTAKLPTIKILPDGMIAAGDFALEPSAAHWRKRRVWWRCRLDGKVVTGWQLTPKLAVAAALRRAS